MNKNDLKLTICLLLISGVLLISIKLLKHDNKKNALIYYEDEIVLTIDLSKDGIYQVQGYNGIVNVVVKQGKIRVDSENSPLHLCSNQGYISETYETIVCLPNKVTIKIENQNKNLDTIVR